MPQVSSFIPKRNRQRKCDTAITALYIFQRSFCLSLNQYSSQMSSLSGPWSILIPEFQATRPSITSNTEIGNSICPSINPGPRDLACQFLDQHLICCPSINTDLRRHPKCCPSINTDLRRHPKCCPSINTDLRRHPKCCLSINTDLR